MQFVNFLNTTTTPFALLNFAITNWIICVYIKDRESINLTQHQRIEKHILASLKAKLSFEI